MLSNDMLFECGTLYAPEGAEFASASQKKPE
jgi:hypothetical protein